MTSRAEHHHIVPRSYLLRFSGGSGELCMHDKSGGEWIETHASNAAVRSNFYTVDLIEEGASDEVESALGTIEENMIHALARVDEGIWPPAEEDRQAIANFTGLQSVRGPDLREFVQTSYDRVGQKLADAIAVSGSGLQKAFTEVMGRHPTDEEIQTLKESMTRTEVRAQIPRNYFITLMLELAGEQARISFAKQLHLLIAPAGRHFVTSDAPLALWSAEPGPFGSVSLMTADEATLPLDRGRCLLLRHPEAEGDRGSEMTCEVDAERVVEINQRTVDHATRFVFCHPDDVGASAPLL